MQMAFGVGGATDIATRGAFLFFGNDVLNIGQSALNINIGSVSNNDSKVINIGGNNDQVNILGLVNNVQSTNTHIKDKLITLNDGSVGNNQSGLVGF